ncbi:hypothetical protein K661_00459 [Piscirickettsia salmonis LF-89 = ATCC VR-1361]|nr:hypothetical protein K661_00459 [Piscirickettsia salmonis LF-89 = ATCC VR-1361]
MLFNIGVNVVVNDEDNKIYYIFYLLCYLKNFIFYKHIIYTPYFNFFNLS